MHVERFFRLYARTDRDTTALVGAETVLALSIFVLPSPLLISLDFSYASSDR